MNKIKNVIVPMHDIIYLSLLKLPFIASEMLPLSLLISCLYFLQNFSKRNEITIILSSGVSIWKLAQPLILSSFLIGVFFVAIIQPISAICLDLESGLERHYLFSKKSSMVSVIDSRLHILEPMNNFNRIITAMNILGDDSSIKGVTILDIDSQNRLIRRIDSDAARFEGSEIHLSDNSFKIDIDGQKHNIGPITLSTSLSFGTILKKFESPENIPFWRLSSLAEELARSGIRADRFVNYYYKLLLRPLYCVAIILLALCFLNINPRGRPSLKLVGYGSIIGFVVHSTKEVGSVMMISAGFGPVFAQSSCIVMVMAASIIILIQLFEVG